jgi:hypothetical protein
VNFFYYDFGFCSGEGLKVAPVTDHHAITKYLLRGGKAPCSLNFDAKCTDSIINVNISLTQA